MKFIGGFLLILYRIWFYTLVTLPIIVLSPILIITISNERWYPAFFRLARIWAKFILMGMGLVPKVNRMAKHQRSKSYMFVANHTSMLDIMMMLYLVKNPFVFVGKKELAKIPIFGYFYKNTNILVDRSDARSRHKVFSEAQRRLSQGLSICIFPEGGVPEDHDVLLDQFKDGAFRLAIEHKIPIAPITLHDNKKRLSYKMFRDKGPGKLRATLHSVIPTQHLMLEDKKNLREEVRQVLLKELQQPSVK